MYRFDQFTVDADAFELRRDGELCALEPRAFKVLLHLIHHRDRVVAREELHDSVWQGRVVTDGALTVQISAIRQALVVSDQQSPRIRTVPRVGYRFVGPVTVIDRPDAAVLSPTGDPHRESESGVSLDGFELPLPSQPSVAVLPFRAVRGDEELFADGLTHEVVTRLSRARWLFVIARGTMFRFRDGPYDERAVGRSLGVRYVVQGFIRVAAGRAELEVALTDAVSGAECWADRIACAAAEPSGMQEELAALIVGTLESSIEFAEWQRSAQKPLASLDAWEAYHRGCTHVYRFTEQGNRLALQSFRHALELDPAAPRCHVGLSFVHWQRAFLLLGEDARAEAQRALDHARRSLELDPKEPSAHWALGRALLRFDEFDQAIEELETSTALDASSALGQYSLGYALMQTGDAPRSLAAVRRAQRLSPHDPLDFAMNAVIAQNLAFLGEHDASAQAATRAARQPNAHRHILAIAAYCNQLAGKGRLAREHFTRLRAQAPGYGFDDFIAAIRHQPSRQVALIRSAFDELDDCC